MTKRRRREMATRSASNSASASGLSTCLVRDTFCCWSSPKSLPAPLPSLSALAPSLTDGKEMKIAITHRPDDSSIEKAWKHAETHEIENLAAALLGKAQDAHVADRRRHLLR